jgi:hypothetical protein
VIALVAIRSSLDPAALTSAIVDSFRQFDPSLYRSSGWIR